MDAKDGRNERGFALFERIRARGNARFDARGLVNRNARDLCLRFNREGSRSIKSRVLRKIPPFWPGREVRGFISFGEAFGIDERVSVARTVESRDQTAGEIVLGGL